MSDDRPQSLQVSFSSFVVGLATSAMEHLGEGPAGTESNLEIARNTIDVLGILSEKTTGNLDPDEAKLLETVLYETRIKFVEKTGG